EVVAGISVQANKVSVTSVIFTRTLRSLIQHGSSCGQMRPERGGPALGNRAPELDRPVALAAELGAPRPQPARRELQRVLVREADRAVHLMRDRGAHAPRFSDPDLRDGDLERGIAAIGGAECAARRRAP